MKFERNFSKYVSMGTPDVRLWKNTAEAPCVFHMAENVRSSVVSQEQSQISSDNLWEDWNRIFIIL